MTSQAPVEKTRSTPDGDVFPEPLTESRGTITNGTITAGAADPVEHIEDAPTVAFAAGADDAAVRGVDEVLGREVRLVTLPPASGEVLSERIEQVRHLARLHHPHLLEVYDVDGLAPDTESTLVLENVPGEPLALVLRDGPIGEPEIARMGAQLASALAHAHAHGVEHGAIGASSVLVHRAHADAWLVGLTASLSGPLPVVDPDADGDDGGASHRRAADVRALAGVLAGIVEHGAAVTGGDDPEAVTRPTAREDEIPASPLAALLHTVDADPPSAEVFSRQLVRVGRGVAAREGREAPARLVPVVASWSESPAAAGPTLPVPGPRSGPATPADGGEVPEQVVPAALAAGPAVRTRGTGGVTPFTVIGPAGRRARRAGVLGAATATLALASGLVIWAGESHLVRPESQAEIGAAAPSAVAPAPLVPQATDAGSTPGGTWGGASDHNAVGVASRKAALPEQRSASRAAQTPRAQTSRAETSRAETTTTTDDPPPTTRPSESSDPRPDGPPVVPPPGTRTTHPRPTTTPPRTTTPPTTDPTTKRPTTDPTKPTTTTRTTTTAPSSTSSTATSSTGASTTTTTSSEPAAADPASLVQAAATEAPSTPATTTLPGQTVLAAGS